MENLFYFLTSNSSVNQSVYSDFLCCFQSIYFFFYILENYSYNFLNVFSQL